ncbi:hypothetical protein D3C81_1513770 [compost metagenome]
MHLQMSAQKRAGQSEPGVANALHQGGIGDVVFITVKSQRVAQDLVRRKTTTGEEHLPGMNTPLRGQVGRQFPLAGQRFQILAYFSTPAH